MTEQERIEAALKITLGDIDKEFDKLEEDVSEEVGKYFKWIKFIVIPAGVLISILGIIVIVGFSVAVFPIIIVSLILAGIVVFTRNIISLFKRKK